MTEYDPKDYELVQTGSRLCNGCAFWKCAVCLVEEDDRFDCGTVAQGYTFKKRDQ